MKINNIKEEDLATLRQTEYAIFDKDGKLCDITIFEEVGYPCKDNYHFDDCYSEFGGKNLKEFLEYCKNCYFTEMFPVSQIIKPI